MSQFLPGYLVPFWYWGIIYVTYFISPNCASYEIGKGYTSTISIWVIGLSHAVVSVFIGIILRSYFSPRDIFDIKTILMFSVPAIWGVLSFNSDKTYKEKKKEGHENLKNLLDK